MKKIKLGVNILDKNKNFQNIYLEIKNNFPDAPDRYEQTLRTIYEFILQEGDVVFDVGAHTGKHTLPMSEAVGDLGTVIAFEPIREKFTELEKKTRNIKNIEIYNVCCSSNNLITNFTYLPDDPGKSSKHIRTKLETVQNRYDYLSLNISLDSFFINMNPSFIKIDVEGAEYEVLLGAKEIIENSLPVIHTELGHDTLSPFANTPSEIYFFFKDRGYVSFDILGNILDSEKTFCESVNAKNVYDYISFHPEKHDVYLIKSLLENSWKIY